MRDEYKEFDEHLSIKAKIGFAFGNNACAMLNGLVSASITFYFNIKLGLNENLLGIMWLIYGIWNTLNSPKLGWVCDNTRSRWGRRIPYIRFGGPILGLVFLLCWIPFTSSQDQIGLASDFLIVMSVFSTISCFIGTSYNCLPTEMVITAKERATIGLYNSVLNIFSTIAQVALPIYLLTGDNPALYSLFEPVMIGIAIGCTCLIFLSSYGIKEHQFAVMQPQESIWKGIVETFRNKSFYSLAILGFFLTLVMNMLITGAFYYSNYVMEFDVNTIGYNLQFEIEGLSVITLTFVGIFVMVRYIPKIGPRKMAIISYASATIGFVLFFIFGRDFFNCLIAFFFIAIGAAGGMIILPPIIGDVIDFDETLTGKRREGMYAGVLAIITKPAISIANWAFLVIIGLFGFISPIVVNGVSTSFQQTDLAKTGILFAISIVPAIFCFICLLNMLYYPLDGPKWLQKKLEIKELHEQKQQQYLEHIAQK
jgi:GPH family glycoside/pentoside/hexuronide:cation symporter